MTRSGSALWSLLTAMAVASSLWSLSASGIYVTSGCCAYGFNASQCVQVMNGAECQSSFNGTFSLGEVCDDGECRPPKTGCCDTGEGFCPDEVNDELGCMMQNGTLLEDATCVFGTNQATTSKVAAGQCATNTPTATATATSENGTPTATATATATGVPDGGECADPADCASGNCVDDVCCESACDGADEACNLPGLEGNCLALSATVPATSSSALAVGLALLALIAVVSITQRRRARARG